MAGNGTKSTEDTIMTECDGDKVVTMMDVLQEQQDFEEDANAVLGASDDKNCTYSKGYVKRQALYACLTCVPDAKTDSTKRVGVCLACSLHCHENHELVELYTKRNFRCDCGNPKFGSQTCQFTPNKTDLNYDNHYNQNFSGVYCVCHRPYPDPEATAEEEMIQCVICEDWLHENHLEATVPLNDQYAEMVCKDCMEDNDFLHDYSDLVINVQDKEIIATDPDLDIDITSILNDKKLQEEKLSNGKTEENEKNGVDTTEKENDTAEKQDNVAIEKEGDDATGKQGDADDTDKNNETKETQDEEMKSNEEQNVSQMKNNDNIEQNNSDKAEEPPKEEEKRALDAETLEKMEEDKLLNDDSNENKVQNGDKASAEDTTKSSEDGNKIDSESNQETDTNKTDEVHDKDSLNTEEKSDEVKDTSTVDSNKRKIIEDSEEYTPKKLKLEEKCTRPRGVKRVYKGATFWPATFRQRLCNCNECTAMYKDLGVLYLIDLDDTVTAYEALGKENAEGPSSQYEKGLQALSSLDRVQQINALTEYNKMRDKLLDFLKSFKDRREIVKEEDIKAFFAGMKPKREPDGVYFCR